MSKTNRLFSIAMLFLLILFSAMPILAQDDVSSELVPPATVNGTYDWAKELSFASLFVTSIVAAAKYIPQLNGIPSNRLSFALSLLLWLGLTIFREFGYADDYIASISNFGSLFQILGNIVTTYLGASAIYGASNVSNMPVLGNKRT